MKMIVVCVGDNRETVEKMKDAAMAQNADFRVYTHEQWTQMTMGTPLFESVTLPVSSLGGAQVLRFPGTQPKAVKTIAEMEMEAIQASVAAHKGNLTGAAKALGIGRATLYRKLKEFKIDPGHARNKKAA